MFGYFIAIKINHSCLRYSDDVFIDVCSSQVCCRSRMLWAACLGISIPIFASNTRIQTGPMFCKEKDICAEWETCTFSNLKGRDKAFCVSLIISYLMEYCHICLTFIMPTTQVYPLLSVCKGCSMKSLCHISSPPASLMYVFFWLFSHFGKDCCKCFNLEGTTQHILWMVWLSILSHLHDWEMMQ